MRNKFVLFYHFISEIKFLFHFLLYAYGVFFYIYVQKRAQVPGTVVADSSELSVY